MKEKSPETEAGLEAWMKENCFNFDSYSINGNVIHEGFGIEKHDDSFIWYYIERGRKRICKVFESEAEIIDYAYHQLKNDKWARMHCIGFTANKEEAQELSKILHSLRVDFIQDEIPYTGQLNPVFRTFVSGCDLKHVENLKAKYYKAAL